MCSSLVAHRLFGYVMVPQITSHAAVMMILLTFFWRVHDKVSININYVHSIPVTLRTSEEFGANRPQLSKEFVSLIKKDFKNSSFLNMSE